MARFLALCLYLTAFSEISGALDRKLGIGDCIMSPEYTLILFGIRVHLSNTPADNAQPGELPGQYGHSYFGCVSNITSI